MKRVLVPGERVLATAADADGRAVVATERDLLLQRRPPDYDRIGWDQVDKATFDAGVLRLTGVGAGGEVLRLRIPLSEAGVLPEVVRDRVTSSIVLSQHVALQGDLGVRITARRRPGEDGLLWRTHVDDELEDSEEIRRAAADAVDGVRRESGLDR